jgi:predicted DNA-binding ribbon-helix-helix protein
MTHNLIRHQDSPANLYEQDYYSWLEQTALSLRKQAFDQLDLENLIEEIEDMGRSEKQALESNLRVVLWHLLKWKYQPQQRSGSWRGSIAEHRIRIRKALQDSPSLKNYLPEVFDETYQDAIKIASQETDLESETFPISCEWTLQNILDEAWLPD